MLRRLSCLLLVSSTLLWADSPPRFSAAFQTSYDGAYQDLYRDQVERVRLLIRQAQLEVSARLGLLQYREGFRYPLTVRFADSAPPGVENALAYVHMVQTSGGVGQEMVVNLSVFSAHATDFDTVFYHEMTHAVLDDALELKDLANVPRWVQEGLAVYVAGNGDTIVAEVAGRIRKSQAKELIQDLDQIHTYQIYPQGYLAFKYLNDKYSVNAVEAFVRDLTQGQSTMAAIEDSTSVSYATFKQQLQEYSLDIYKENARPDF